MDVGCLRRMETQCVCVCVFVCVSGNQASSRPTDAEGRRTMQGHEAVKLDFSRRLAQRASSKKYIDRLLLLFFSRTVIVFRYILGTGFLATAY